MQALIQQHRDAIDEICRRHNVKRLEVFGSAARDDFDAQTSDVDFFVEFISYDSPHIADDWFGLHEELSRTLARPVDLVVPSAVRNQRFLDHARRTAITVYAN